MRVVSCSSVGAPTVFVCLFVVYCDVGWFVVVVRVDSLVCAVFVYCVCASAYA